MVERLGSGKRDGGAKITSASPKLKKLSFTQQGYGFYFRNYYDSILFTPLLTKGSANWEESGVRSQRGALGVEESSEE
ncbi:MAG: hypothetical protein BRC38_11560 [Cyanobacteria bacterium QH_6_48_35]|nr:MAG: hypothetical protein BRC38_11560 [Cyanobacteria bacterium QH_6_48_35]